MVLVQSEDAEPMDIEDLLYMSLGTFFLFSLILLKDFPIKKKDYQTLERLDILKSQEDK